MGTRGRGKMGDLDRGSREEVEIVTRCPPAGSWAWPAEGEEEGGRGSELFYNSQKRGQG